MEAKNRNGGTRGENIDDNGKLWGGRRDLIYRELTYSLPRDFWRLFSLSLSVGYVIVSWRVKIYRDLGQFFLGSGSFWWKGPNLVGICKGFPWSRGKLKLVNNDDNVGARKKPWNGRKVNFEKTIFGIEVSWCSSKTVPHLNIFQMFLCFTIQRGGQPEAKQWCAVAENDPCAVMAGGDWICLKSVELSTDSVDEVWSFYSRRELKIG